MAGTNPSLIEDAKTLETQIRSLISPPESDIRTPAATEGSQNEIRSAVFGPGKVSDQLGTGRQNLQKDKDGRLFIQVRQENIHCTGLVRKKDLCIPDPELVGMRRRRSGMQLTTTLTSCLRRRDKGRRCHQFPYLDTRLGRVGIVS